MWEGTAAGGSVYLRSHSGEAGEETSGSRRCRGGEWKASRNTQGRDTLASRRGCRPRIGTKNSVVPVMA